MLKSTLAAAVLATVANLALAEEYANPDLIVETASLNDQLHTDNIRIVDMRSADEFAAGHVPGAVHIDPDRLIDPNAPIEGDLRSPAELSGLLGENGIDHRTRVILYDDRGGFRAARLFWLLEYFGHRDVAILNGGFQKWTREERPVSTDRAAPAATMFTPGILPRKLATADWLMERRNNPDVVVVDVRPEELHRKGRIPWAGNIPWAMNLQPDKTMKPADELRAHFESRGVTKDKSVAVHCQNGKAASHSYFALRLLGYPMVRTYDRSWADWGSADDLPKAGDIAG